jgi:hypothetical protein
MSNSTHQFKVKGVDATGKLFDTIGAKAKATGASIRAALGGALAAAGAYLSLRSAAGAVNQLGQLSDLAMKAGMSVEFLTKATTAFQVAGLNVSAESLVKAMQFMQKNTGKQGEGAFFDIAKQIAAISDVAQRAQAAVQVFGRSGLELLPLVNNGQEAIDKFQKLQSIMPGVSTAAANAGDAANDALTIFGKGAQAIMLKAVGKICALWGDEFPGGVRAGALNAINWLETFFKKAWAWFEKLGNYIGAFAGLITNAFDGGIGEAWEIFSKQIDDTSNKYESRIEDINAQREDYKKTLSEMSVDDLANPFGKAGGAAAAGESFGAAAAKRISNALILGNSNQANRLAILGPQYQNEAKKQTSLLEKIAKNTEKTAENTEEGGEQLAATDL